MRRNLFEHFEPLRANRVLKRDKSCNVAAGPSQTGDDAGTDRVDYPHEYDWYTPCGPLQRSKSKAGWRDQNVGCHRNQFGSLARVAIRIIGTPANIEVQVAALGPA